MELQSGELAVAPGRGTADAVGLVPRFLFKLSRSALKGKASAPVARLVGGAGLARKTSAKEGLGFAAAAEVASGGEAGMRRGGEEGGVGLRWPWLSAKWEESLVVR